MSPEVLMLADKTYGSYFKELRIKYEMTLRDFCRKSYRDAGNQSKMERDILHPPSDLGTLMAHSKILNCSKQEIINLCYLACNHHVSLIKEEFRMI